MGSCGRRLQRWTVGPGSLTLTLAKSRRARRWTEAEWPNCSRYVSDGERRQGDPLGTRLAIKLPDKDRCSMLSRCSLRCEWVGCVLAVSILSLATIGCDFREKGDARKPKQDPKALKKMIDDLANRNAPPKLIAGLGGSPGTVPLFPENYDWEEQERVLGALARLEVNPTEELWEELVRHVDDERYSLTVMNNSGVYAEGNMTVGYFCLDLAEKQLRRVFERHLPAKERDERERKIPIPVGIETNLKVWRQKRMKKSFCELQIEVCEQALKELDKVKGVAETKLAAAREGIAEEIKELKRTNRPVLIRASAVGGNDLYSARSAKGLREELAKAGLIPKK